MDEVDGCLIPCISFTNVCLIDLLFAPTWRINDAGLRHRIGLMSSNTSSKLAAKKEN